MSSIKGPYAAAPRAWKENEAHEIAKRAGPSHDLNQYAGQLRADLTKRGIEPVIPPRSNRKTPIEYDQEAYKRSNLLDRRTDKGFDTISVKHRPQHKGRASANQLGAGRV